ncbi:mitotic-spindle organizing protein 1 [Phlyctochytrium arcticum]|nr:mitotic-spindle organizing protein 1 [Phlyctochytrium arcticum]
MDSATKLTTARESLSVLHEISTLLNTGLDRESLALCVSLCESGVNPEALAAVIRELKREGSKTSTQGGAVRSDGEDRITG